MRIAHLGDVHIGAGRKWYPDLNSEEPFYLKRHKSCLQEILDKSREYAVDQFILAGDLLDHARPFAREYSLLAWWLYQLSLIAPVHIIAGNHENIDAFATALHPVRDMVWNSNIHWHLDLSVTKELWGQTLWCSHMHTPKLQVELDKDNSIEYVVAHYAAKGCVYENHMTPTKGWVFNYNPEKIKQVFVCDIHLRQRIASNCFYPGSPLQLNFGESGQKGFDIYDTETQIRTHVPLSKAIPLMTVIANEKLPDFIEGALYRVYASKTFIDYSFPPNVVSVQLFERKKDQLSKEQLVAEDIDFGDELFGLKEVLMRAKLDDSLHLRAIEEAKIITCH